MPSLLDRNHLLRTYSTYKPLHLTLLLVSFSHTLVYLIKNAITRAFTHFRAMKSPRDTKSGRDAVGNCILRQYRGAALSQILSTGMVKRQVVKHDSWIRDETIGRELARPRACNRLFAFCARIAAPICIRTRRAVKLA